jgi:hypothetical protein
VVIVEVIEERPKYKVSPDSLGTKTIRSCPACVSVGSFPNAIRSLLRNNSFVEKEPDIIGYSDDSQDNFLCVST